MLSQIQEKTIKAIINVFETSSVLGDYSKVTLIPGDTGQLTYGRSQTTLTSGGLYLLVDGYCQRTDSQFSTPLAQFLAALQVKDAALNTNIYFHNLLRAAADDPAMRAAQDDFFDTRYWQPALDQASHNDIETPLGCAVVYDSIVHGSWPYIKRKTTTAIGSPWQVGEQAWVTEYVSQRYDWLANHRRGDLRATVYRMQAFKKLITNAEWALALPQVIRGLEINPNELGAVPPKVYTGPQPRTRDITLTTPVTRGLDVRLAQLALSKPGNDLQVVADGIFGRLSSAAVKDFQQSNGLAGTGVVDSDVFDALGV